MIVRLVTWALRRVGVTVDDRPWRVIGAEPCPLCGSQPISVQRWMGWAIRCDKCRMTTTWEIGQNWAVIEWNQRASMVSKGKVPND